MDDAFQKLMRGSLLEIFGSSGTRVYSGFLLEEYLNQLTHIQRAFNFDMMRRSDPAIGQLINIIRNTVSSLSHQIVPKVGHEKSAVMEKQKKLVEMAMLQTGKTFRDTIYDITTNTIYGFSFFEGLWENETVPGLGMATTLKALLWRSPKTIYEWHTDDYEQLEYVVQRAYGDNQTNDVNIPTHNAFLFPVEREGNLFEGISPLRRCYGPWRIKQDLFRLLVIGSDKYSIPSLIFKGPSAKNDDKIITDLVEQVRGFTNPDGTSVLVIPNQFELVNPNFPFDPEKILKGIEICNREIIKEASAEFLMMDKGGSYALGSAVMKFFHQGIDARTTVIKNEFNNRIIPMLLNFNGAGESEVELQFTPAGASINKEFAESITSLINGKVITPDMELEAFCREMMRLPKHDEKTARVEYNPGMDDMLPGMPKKGGDDDKKKKDDDDDKVKKKVNSLLSEFAQPKYIRADRLMKKSHRVIGEVVGISVDVEASRIIKKLASHWKRAKDEAEKMKLPNFAVRQNTIRKNIQSIYKGIFEQSFVNAEKEVRAKDERRGGKAKLSFAKKEGLVYSEEDAVLLASLLSEKAQGLLGSTYMTFALEVDTVSKLVDKLEEAAATIPKKKEVIAHIDKTSKTLVNKGRRDYFQSIDEKIESYTWRNEAPVTTICSYLNNKTFKTDELSPPPLHFGCKSWLEVNLKEWSDNPDVDEISLTPKMKEEAQFLI